MKKKITLILSVLVIINLVSIAVPESFFAKTISSIAYAQDCADSTYTDEQGTFRVMVRITSNTAEVKDGVLPWSKTLFKPNKSELYNYRGNILGSYIIYIGKEYGEDKNNYQAYLPNKYADVVKLYNDGTIVETKK